MFDFCYDIHHCFIRENHDVTAAEQDICDVVILIQPLRNVLKFFLRKDHRGSIVSPLAFPETESAMDETFIGTKEDCPVFVSADKFRDGHLREFPQSVIGEVSGV